MAQELLADTRQLVRQAVLQKGAYFSLHQVARYIEAIAKLSAIALGEEEDDGMQGPNGYPIPLSIKQAVERIYGPGAGRKGNSNTEARSSKQFPEAEKEKDGTGGNRENGVSTMQNTSSKQFPE